MIAVQFELKKKKRTNKWPIYCFKNGPPIKIKLHFSNKVFANSSILVIIIQRAAMGHFCYELGAMYLKDCSIICFFFPFFVSRFDLLRFVLHRFLASFNLNLK